MTASAVPQRRPAPKTVTSFSRSWKENISCWKDWWLNSGKVSEVSAMKTVSCLFVRPKSTMASEHEKGSASSKCAQSLQSCLTLRPMDCSPPDTPVPGILQARTLEWVAISFSNAGKWKVKVKSLSRVWPSATPWMAAYQAPPSMGFSRQEHWSGVPLPSPNNTCILL